MGKAGETRCSEPDPSRFVDRTPVSGVSVRPAAYALPMCLIVELGRGGVIVHTYKPRVKAAQAPSPPCSQIRSSERIVREIRKMFFSPNAMFRAVPAWESAFKRALYIHRISRRANCSKFRKVLLIAAARSMGIWGWGTGLQHRLRFSSIPSRASTRATIAPLNVG